jgi:hypothetical protein
MDSNKFRNRAVTKRRRDITIWRIVTDEDSQSTTNKGQANDNDQKALHSNGD